MKKREHRKKILLPLLLALLLAAAFTLAACGDSSGDEDSEAVATTATKATQAGDDFSVDVDPHEELSEEEKAKLRQEAVKKNQDADNFIGTWKGDDDVAYNLYGNMIITINKDGTFDADLGDGEEVFSGTWKKINNGISYKSELMSGKFYFGEYCEMTIDNAEWDYDDESEGMAVTMTKIK